MMAHEAQVIVVPLLSAHVSFPFLLELIFSRIFTSKSRRCFLKLFLCSLFEVRVKLHYKSLVDCDLSEQHTPIKLLSPLPEKRVCFQFKPLQVQSFKVFLQRSFTSCKYNVIPKILHRDTSLCLAPLSQRVLWILRF